ncbi:MAG: hypothetical protein R3B70_35950 [Polyangiaceae bacterium]
MCENPAWAHTPEYEANCEPSAPAADCTHGAGACVEEAPDGWMGPNLYWIGLPEDNPGCPPQAKLSGTQLWADLAPVPHTCPTCTCGPSKTTCVPPTEWTIAAAKCADAANAPAISFDVAASTWSGTCNPDNALEKGAMCGGVLCAQSVTVAAPKAKGAPCQPMAQGELTGDGPPWPWGKVAQECLVTPTESCPGGDGTGDDSSEGLVCVPVPGDLLACVSYFHRGAEGEVECPAFYNERHEMFEDARDERACSPCSCRAPEGGTCAMTLGVFADSACSSYVAGGVVFSDDEQACHDLPSGIALAGKVAEPNATFPGSCPPSGGKPIGAVEPVDRVTLCCHHEVVP